MLWILLIVPLLALFYLYVKRKHSYWERRGVPYMKPKFFFGSLDLIQKKCWNELIKDYYDSFPDQRYMGGYMFLQPFLFIRDLDLIKKITVKEFDHFVDRRTVSTDDIDPFWSRNLTNLQGERWRDLRTTLSPSFTGSKMKLMFGLMENCARNFVEHYRSGESDIATVEIKDALSRYSNDVIATTAFGLECNSFENKQNEFFMMGKDVSDIRLLRLLRFMVYSISPTLTKLLNIKVIPPYIAKYFSKIIEDTVKLREENNTIRPDMIHLMMEMQKGGKHHEEDSKSEESGGRKITITMEDIIAQAFIFFVAGFETVSALLNFTLYELALNPDIQDRLREEVDDLTHDKITPEKLHSMRYLEMVIMETLRKWAPAGFTDRVVTKTFTIEPEKPGEVPLTLEKGIGCMIPIWGIHHDPEYYPEPEKFDPERFNEENRKKRDPGAFIPFGMGPRFCIGNRFALQEGKLLLFHVMKNFEIVPVKETLIPMVLDPKQFSLVAKGGMWLGLKKRQK